MSFSLVLGRGLGKKVVDPGFAGNGSGGQRIVAGDHHGANPHGPQLREAVANSSLDHIFEMNDAHGPPVLGDDERCAARRGDALDRGADFLRHGGIILFEIKCDGVGSAFADLPAIQVDSGHSGLGGEGDEFCLMRGEVAAAQLVSFLGQDDDGAAFWSFVGQRRELCGVGHIGFGDSGCGEKFGGLPVAESNRASFVEQQRVHVSCCFDRTAGHREYVVLHEAVHAGDSDGR